MGIQDESYPRGILWKPTVCAGLCVPTVLFQYSGESVLACFVNLEPTLEVLDLAYHRDISWKLIFFQSDILSTSKKSSPPFLFGQYAHRTALLLPIGNIVFGNNSFHQNCQRSLQCHISTCSFSCFHNYLIENHRVSCSKDVKRATVDKRDICSTNLKGCTRGEFSHLGTICFLMRGISEGKIQLEIEHISRPREKNTSSGWVN